MSAFQVCARCSTRWPVGTRPAVWCPRCHGVLLSPVSIGVPDRGVRNFKWVARAPRKKPVGPRAASKPRSAETPKYDEMPRWGLVDQPISEPDGEESRIERWAAAAPGMLTLTGILLLLAGAAELSRYGILLYNRTRLVNSATLIISDAFVSFAGLIAIVTGVSAAVASACWLCSRRHSVFERANLREPRSVRELLIGSLVPGLSLVMPGVFLTELVTVRGGSDRARLLVAVRIWWGLWVFDWALIAAAMWWRTRDSLQAQADGVLFYAFVSLVGACLAVWTIRVMRGVDNLRWRGSEQAAPKRWVVAGGRAAAASEAAAELEAPAVPEPELGQENEDEFVPSGVQQETQKKAVST